MNWVSTYIGLIPYLGNIVAAASVTSSTVLYILQLTLSLSWGPFLNVKTNYESGVILEKYKGKGSSIAVII